MAKHPQKTKILDSCSFKNRIPYPDIGLYAYFTVIVIQVRCGTRLRNSYILTLKLMQGVF